MKEKGWFGSELGGRKGSDMCLFVQLRLVAMHDDYIVDFLIGYFCLGVVSIGILIPSSPGHIGVFEVSIILAFQILGIDLSLGAAYALAIHFTQLVTILIMGIIIAPKAITGLNITSAIFKKI